MNRLSESQRIRRLREIGILDTPDDRLFRGFAEQALSLMPGASVAAVSLVDAGRQWFKSAVGTDVKETPRSVSFCAHTIKTSGVMVVEDATQDGRFADNPLVTGPMGIRFYAGVKLMDGVGALCVIGKQPRQASVEEIKKLVKLAYCVDIQMLAHGTLFNLGPDGGV